MALIWQVSKPKSDPFAAIVGDRQLYQVHFAVSEAIHSADVENAIGEILGKALEFINDVQADRRTRLLILWDSVYAILTAVYTDFSMMQDAHLVTKCQFVAIDGTDVAKSLESELPRMIHAQISRLESNLSCCDLPIFYSAQDRASVGETGFSAFCLVG